MSTGTALVFVGGTAADRAARLDPMVDGRAVDGLVLRAAGTMLESDIPYAGLHQLLRPVLDRAEALPDRQRAALGVLFGEGAPDRLLLGVAVLNLLAEIGPVLVVVADMQWLDPDSLRVLTFVARRLDGEPVAFLGASDRDHFGLPHERIGPLAVSAPVAVEPVAALEERARHAVSRGAYATAARLLERAGHPLRAAELAILVGYPGWAQELLSRVDGRQAEVSLRRGQALALTPRRDAAQRLLVDAAKELSEPLASEAVASAAIVAYYTGRRDGVHGDSLWVRALVDPSSVSSAEIADVPDDPAQLTAYGTMAWLIDETAVAIELFERATDLAQLPDVLRCAAGWAYLEAGQWASARLVAAASARAAADGDLPHTSAAATILDATVLALQGDSSSARSLALDALASMTPRASGSVIARGRWALGLAAMADGDFESAYDQFRLMFADEHYQITRLAVADLAAAAARTGHDVSSIVDGIEPFSRRQRMLLARARALSTPDFPEPHFLAALADSADWPFDHARTQLDYAEWLRRRLRPAEARPHLVAALETFRRLGARPWISRTLAELRAAGVRDVDAAPNRLLELTPQQQEIVRLAAQGLSNKEIGERLFLSPRTVGSHLYRSFPKLGVTSRGQLHQFFQQHRL
ncbi:helix-turn-helix transcriptional regulator [Kutzneria sp. CA-103260]|uniref:helix-turn-helix transcriptional regulator n=1 Tax=Kutzneria sp. CA-103260 TaxID=2802641 RepID=UPI001BAB3CCE|nr:helix-turn-helix transcriptional regulator [Kutzneria sp. CA-103260]QUQ62371.1 Bacterial regulatory protein, luxR family [Kutzneria sp. CA-103260]